jgi:8-oxo-dGTP pyrophosphatase MutT (NUDIX family)
MKETSQTDHIPTVKQVSAGGVACRFSSGSPEIAVVLIIPELRWQLPKGIVDEGESFEQAALREVREEAGIKCRMVEPIETIEYWFTTDRDGSRMKVHKLVHFFLLEYLSGDVADHDHEVQEGRWVTPVDALAMLEFKSEREVVERAAMMIRERSSSPI